MYICVCVCECVYVEFAYASVSVCYSAGSDLWKLRLSVKSN